MSLLPVRRRRLSAQLVLALALAAAPWPAAAQSLTFTHLAGSDGGPGSNDGLALEARFNGPNDIALAPSGPFYVLDGGNQVVRRLSMAGVVTLAGLPGRKGYRDGHGAVARFDDPQGIAVDAAGDVYVADTGNHVIRKITPTGQVSTFAGSPGQAGSTDATGAAARFDHPWGIAVDGAGNLYVSDSWNHTIRKITPGGVVSTLAGLAPQYGSADGTGSAARFKYPGHLDVDASGNVWVADVMNYTIRKVTAAGVVTTAAGAPGQMDSVDGRGGGARFAEVLGLALSASGDIYVTEQFADQSKLRTISDRGFVTTLGGGPEGLVDGPVASARFCRPAGLVVDASGGLFVTDTWNHAIRYIQTTLDVQTIAGRPGLWKSTSAGNPDADFSAQPLWFHSGSHSDYGFFSWVILPTGLAVDGAGTVYVADYLGDAIRKVSPSGIVTTLAGGHAGSEDGTGAAAGFRNPDGIAVGRDGTIYVADQQNSTIRRVTRDGQVTTLAGHAAEDGSNDGPGASARFRRPRGLAIDHTGTLYVADAGNHTIRKVTPAGEVTTLAGLAQAPGSADGVGSQARFWDPHGIGVDGAGNVYVADTTNSTIRKITPAGLVTTLAGQAGASATVDGTGAGARFTVPVGLAVDPGGNVYVTEGAIEMDQPAQVWIRRITSEGVVTTVAGGNAQTADGTGTAARFRAVVGIAADRAGNVYVRDAYSIRKGVPGPRRFEANPALDIPDLDTVEAMLNVLGVTGVVEKVTLSIRLAHTYVGDLTLSLIGPDGTTVLLSARNGANGDDYGTAELPDTLRTIFDDEAASSIVGASAPFVGSFRPQETLSAFAGKPGAAVNGTWRLSVVDDGPGDVGVLAAWSIDLHMQYPHVTNVYPEKGPARGGHTVTVGGWGFASSVTPGVAPRVFIDGVEVAVQAWGPASATFVVPALPGGRKTVVVIDADGQVGVLADAYFAKAPFLSDFDGDGRADVSVYRPSTGTWFWMKSSVNNTSYAYRGWGIDAKGDTPVPGDFDGDGIADPTVFRPSTGTWFVLRSLEGYTQWSYFGWGTAGDVPVPGDYDGDAITDGAVYRPSTGTWYVRPSSNPDAAWQMVFGTTIDVPVPADYDGDGLTDIAVYRDLHGTWFLLTSSSAYVSWSSHGWGVNDHFDTPIPGDYTDGGMADIAVYRPATGTWFILVAEGNFTTWTYGGWGGPGDTPVPADYDADGIADLAVFRPATGDWYVYPTLTHTSWEVNFGVATDKPLPRPQ